MCVCMFVHVLVCVCVRAWGCVRTRASVLVICFIGSHCFGTASATVMTFAWCGMSVECALIHFNAIIICCTAANSPYVIHFNGFKKISCMLTKCCATAFVRQAVITITLHY